jgi:2-succinyl-6-hydroxy-2,4-cyclohexadiene-1-carboxylate synthase
MSQELKTQVFMLPGFLGLPTDWDPVARELQKVRPNWELIPVDFRDPKISPANTLRSWGGQFNEWVRQQNKAHVRLLVGYSMGGRLAAHALIEDPDLWQAAVFISTHPGLQLIDEVELREKSDAYWAQRFAEEDFQKVMEDWNAQAVFVGSQKEPLRERQHYPTGFLEKCLSNWSLAKQDDLRDRIYKANIPQVWLAGQRDVKFMAILKQLKYENGHRETPFMCETIKSASHRALFDQPSAIAQIISDFAQLV